MHPVDIIRKKRDGHVLTRPEIEAFVQGVTGRTWPDYQTSALLMAIVLRGMNGEETADLTRAMVQSGLKLDLSNLPGIKVDKHSSGGVGDKTSLVVVPLAAACGVIVPKMSGRGLGHTGGTLDKLESIPGFRVNISLPSYREALATIGCTIIGQTADLAPADKIIYALRDVTATVESIALITGSIMSKKIAEGIDAAVLDVKCGRGAFMKHRADARKLAESLVATGHANGVRTEVFVTAMDAPLGRAVGNALEVTEALETLKGGGPADLETLAVTLATRMVILAGKADSAAHGEVKVREALKSGRALEKFRAIIAQQGGNPEVVDNYGLLPAAPSKITVQAEHSGYVSTLDAELFGRATMLLGAGRDRIDDKIDHAVGGIVLKTVGEQVQAGDPLAELHYRDPARLEEALDLVRQAYVIAATPPEPLPLILEFVYNEPEA
jgi:pyrimidine-nucleoside phosphorylase